MDILKVTHDATGKHARVELNGMILPLEAFDITTSLSNPHKKKRVILTLDVDEVSFVIGEVDATIVDADTTPRQIAAPEGV